MNSNTETLEKVAKEITEKSLDGTPGGQLFGSGLPNFGLPILPAKVLNHRLSKTARGECKNEGCDNFRRPGSAFCQPCSDFHNKKINK